MGHLARELVGSARAETVSQLRRAYADEWHAHYNFRLVAATLAGHRAPAVVTLLSRMSDQSLQRSVRLARRLCELGELPPKRLKDVVEAASDKPFKLPEKPTDVAGALRAVLDAQRTSLREYDQLWRLVRDRDAVTERIAARHLADAARDEETIERLLGDAAPEMTGGT